MFRFGQAVTVWLEERDKFGDVTVTGERTIANCAVSPRSSVEDDGNRPGQAGRPRSIVATELVLHAPPRSGVTAQHRVRLANGRTYRVVGDPEAWVSPYSGRYPIDQINLERVTG